MSEEVKNFMAKIRPLAQELKERVPQSPKEMVDMYNKYHANPDEYLEEKVIEKKMTGSARTAAFAKLHGAEFYKPL